MQPLVAPIAAGGDRVEYEKGDVGYASELNQRAATHVVTSLAAESDF